MARLQHKRQPRTDRPADGLLSRLVTVSSPNDVASEAYRILRTNLLYALADAPPRAIVVTSPGSAEGKTTTCGNLGVTLAQVGKDVLILDCDFRQPTVHRLFGLRDAWGVVNVLTGDRSLQGICSEPLPGLKVAPAGPIPSNPAELLSTRKFAALLDQARQEFDYVLIDSQPMQLFSDAMILSVVGDGVLLVVDSNTRRKAVSHTINSLEVVGANVVGTVMNNISASHGQSYGYHYDRYRSGK